MRSSRSVQEDPEIFLARLNAFPGLQERSLHLAKKNSSVSKWRFALASTRCGAHYTCSRPLPCLVLHVSRIHERMDSSDAAILWDLTPRQQRSTELHHTGEQQLPRFPVKSVKPLRGAPRTGGQGSHDSVEGCMIERTNREPAAMTHEEAEVPPVSRPSMRTLDLEKWKYHQGHKLERGSKS